MRENLGITGIIRKTKESIALLEKEDTRHG